MSTDITRVTMLKIAPENLTIALEGFKTFTETQKKNGVPYIVSMQAGPAEGSVKEQGFTFVAKSVFKNMEDIEYYNTECAAHQTYKAFLKEKAPVQELMSVYFTPSVTYEI